MNNNGKISIENLCFRYNAGNEKWDLNNVSVDINPGDFIVVLGPSGAGKSTFVKCLNGIIPNQIKGDYRGTVLIDNINPAESQVNTLAGQIGIVFQDYETQLFSSEIQDDILFGPENYNVSRAKMEVILKETLDILGMNGMERRSIFSLSGGQKQKVAIGSILALEPDVIVMDEPTTDLDPVSKEGIFTLSNNYKKSNKNVTMIITEQEIEEVLNADKIIVFDKGKIVCYGTPKDILAKTELLCDLGIKPLQVAEYFKKINNQLEEVPFTPEDGFLMFNKNGLSISEDIYNKLLEREKKDVGQDKEIIIKADNVSYKYEENNEDIIKEINLLIHSGEFISILGQNGCGKTTLVKLLNGLKKPSIGTVEIMGKNSKQLSIKEISQNVAYVFQNPDHQIFCDTIYDEIAFGLRNMNVDEDTIKNISQEVLEIVGLSDKGFEDPFSMSKGDRQKIAVATALASRPQIIILDEPTTGLDYKEQKEMMEILKRLNDNGSTIIVVTHAMWVAAEYSSRIIVMNSGSIVLDNNPRTIFSQNEKLLNSLFLKIPHIIQMGNKIGKVLLSVDEMLECTIRKEEI